MKSNAAAEVEPAQCRLRAKPRRKCADEGLAKPATPRSPRRSIDSSEGDGRRSAGTAAERRGGRSLAEKRVREVVFQLLKRIREPSPLPMYRLLDDVQINNTVPLPSAASAMSGNPSLSS